MIKFFQSANLLNGSNLLIALPTHGICGNFASDLLVKNNKFERIGIYYSQYLYSSIGLHSDGNIHYNAELYFNSSKNLLLLNFLATVNTHYIQNFYDEFVKVFVDTYKVKEITLFGSADHTYIRADKELFNKNVDSFFLSNSQTDFENKYKLRKLESFLVEPKKKEFEELKLIEGQSFIKKFIKLLSKSKITYSYVFVLAIGVFDPFAGLGLYNKLCYIHGLSNEDTIVQRDFNSITSFFQGFKLNIDPGWLLFLKE